MILMMVEVTKSYIWFGGPYKALNHPRSSSRNPCGPNWMEQAEEEQEEAKEAEKEQEAEEEAEEEEKEATRILGQKNLALSEESSLKQSGYAISPMA